jgi:hypothetical protein
MPPKSSPNLSVVLRTYLSLNWNNPKKPPNEFIHYVDQRMGELNRVPVEFDYTKVPVWRNKLKGLDQ